MDLTKILFDLNGKQVNPPAEWTGLAIAAGFEDDATQANISSQEFTFVGEARESIMQWIDDGYFYEGMPFGMKLKKGALDYVAFKGFLNLQKSFVDEVGNDKVKAKIEKLDGLNTIGEKLGGVSFGYLESIGLINSIDVEYVVEKRKTIIEIIVAGLMIYLLTKELKETVMRLAKNTSDAIALIAGGGLTGGLGAAILSIARVAIDLAYTIAMVIAITKMVKDMLDGFISPVRKYKCCSWFEMMKGAANYLGYNFASSIPELVNVHCLPSKPHDEKIKTGVPRASDAGYNCGDFFAIMARTFSGKIGVVGNTIHFENKDSDFWIKQATYKLRDHFIVSKRKNGEELAGTVLVSMATDPVDEHTIQNIKGTYFEVKVNQKDYRNGIEYLTIDGVDDRNIPYALGNRKDKLSDLEKVLKSMAQLADNVVRTLGGSSNLAGKITNRVGMLKMGTDSHTVARAIYLQNGKVPFNHRDLFSTRSLYEKYIKADSFVLSKNGGQKEVFEGIRLKFGFVEFLQLVENSYFVADNGTTGKVISIDWAIDSDYADISYWIKDPNPTNKLIERYIEPS